MLGKKKKALHFGVFACVLLILFSTTAALTSAEEPSGSYLGEVNGVQVDLSTDDNPILTMSTEQMDLYSIEYEKVMVGNSELALEGDWDVTYDQVEDARFPHIRVRMDREIETDALKGHIYFTINVITSSENTEVSFSFTLEDITYMASERIWIIHDIDANGRIVREPGEEEPGKGLIEYYEFAFPDGREGFYSWSRDSKVGEEEKNSTFMTFQDGGKFAIGTEYEPGAEEVSMSPVDLDNTRVSAVVPTPETYDRVPSFVVGALVTGGFVVGIVFEKRKEFYEKKESTSFLRLEDSPYYKGKE